MSASAGEASSSGGGGLDLIELLAEDRCTPMQRDKFRQLYETNKDFKREVYKRQIFHISLPATWLKGLRLRRMMGFIEFRDPLVMIPSDLQNELAQPADAFCKPTVTKPSKDDRLLIEKIMKEGLAFEDADDSIGTRCEHEPQLRYELWRQEAFIHKKVNTYARQEKEIIALIRKDPAVGMKFQDDMKKIRDERRIVRAQMHRVKLYLSRAVFGPEDTLVLFNQQERKGMACLEASSNIAVKSWGDNASPEDIAKISEALVDITSRLEEKTTPGEDPAAFLRRFESPPRSWMEDRCDKVIAESKRESSSTAKTSTEAQGPKKSKGKRGRAQNRKSRQIKDQQTQQQHDNLAAGSEDVASTSKAAAAVKTPEGSPIPRATGTPREERGPSGIASPKGSTSFAGTRTTSNSPSASRRSKGAGTPKLAVPPTKEETPGASIPPTASKSAKAHSGSRYAESPTKAGTTKVSGTRPPSISPRVAGSRSSTRGISSSQEAGPSGGPVATNMPASTGQATGSSQIGSRSRSPARSALGIGAASAPAQGKTSGQSKSQRKVIIAPELATLPDPLKGTVWYETSDSDSNDSGSKKVHGSPAGSQHGGGRTSRASSRKLSPAPSQRTGQQASARPSRERSKNLGESFGASYGPEVVEGFESMSLEEKKEDVGPWQQTKSRSRRRRKN